MSELLAGKYQMENKIADGGMGAVWKAKHVTLGRTVAVKTPHEQFARDESFSRRFLREARAMARMQQDNIIQVFDVFEKDDRQYLVMEYFPSRSLKELLIEGTRFSQTQSLQIGLQIARALAFAHQHGVVHRDVKPANILINDEYRVKLADFGIAAAVDEVNLTLTGEVVGTPRYMSPEQARGEDVDARSDVFSFGIVLYELIAQKTPLDGKSYSAAVGMLGYQEQEFVLDFPPHTPQALSQLISHMLKRRVEDRVQTMQAVVDILQKLVRDPDATVLNSATADNDATRVQSVKSTAQELPKEMSPVPDKSGKTTILIGSGVGVTLVGIVAFLVLGQSPDTQTAPTNVAPTVELKPTSPLAMAPVADKQPVEKSEVSTSLTAKNADSTKSPASTERYAKLASSARALLENLRDLDVTAQENGAPQNAAPTYRLAQERFNAASAQLIELEDAFRHGAFDKLEKQYSNLKQMANAASSGYQRAIELAEQKSKPAVPANAQTGPASKPAHDDLDIVTAKLQDLKLAYEARNMSRLLEISKLSAPRESLLKQLFAQYDVIEVSVDGTSVNGNEARAILTINRLVTKAGDVVFPGESWKTARLTMRKSDGQWREVEW